MMLASHAIVNQPVLVQPYSCICPRHQISVAVFAEPFLQGRGQPYLVFHRYPSRHLHIFVRKIAVLLEMFFCQPEQEYNSCLCYLQLFCRLFMEFSWHFILDILDRFKYFVNIDESMAQPASKAMIPSSEINVQFPAAFRPGQRVALTIDYHPQKVPAELIGQPLDYSVQAPGFLPKFSGETIKVGLEGFTETIELEAGIFYRTKLYVSINHGRELVRVAQFQIVREKENYFTAKHIDSYLSR